MAKQLNVSLAFTADTSQAAAQIRNLQQQLSAISNQPVSIGQHMTTEIQEAANAAAQLKMHLQNATNVKTGTLDFGRLNQSLQQSGVSLSQYASKLLAIGPQGRQAFMQLATSVAQAEVPLRRSNALLSQMGTTLMNTARWQLSSSLLHGFMGAISKAYNYSKDLNESLNNIRIVTGYNTDQMTKFAAEANKAAKALSTTTTAYTNASLIYYQQGLSDAEVKSRADVTIKLANVSRQSAEIVSDQMTAIWNNFYDGGKSLEYYADVVTALGAATASSSEEIATGLEKFAAVAETVGLSYEYATAALATVTATTRQSADIVGTAFKTLFARLSDLKLGETLEDGTTLGQYSANLAKIGVNIKDASGNLKDMDTILNETAEKWDNLDKAQQVALAKGVAGIRQYTQFIALMDNWDFMEENLATANSSSGTLTKQAEIYEESWEAASKRVQASLETIYESVMDDEFFIDLTNGFAKLIDGVGGFVKSIGGLQGVLSTLGYVLTRVFAEQMTDGFKNLAYNIQMSTEAGRILVQQAKQREMSEMTRLIASTETAAGGTAATVYSEQLQMQTELLTNAERLTQEETIQLQMMLERKQHLADEAIALAEQSEQLKIQAGILESKNMSASWNTNNTILSPEVSGNFRKAMLDIGAAEAVLDGISRSAEVSELQINDLTTAFKKLGLTDDSITDIISGLKGVDGAGDIAQQSIVSLRQELELIKKGQISNVLGKDGFQLKASSKAYKEATMDVQAWGEALINAGHKQKSSTIAVENGRRVQEQFNATMGASAAVTQTWAQSLTNVISSLMSAGMLISSITGLMDTLSNPDTTGWEKFGSILMSVSMVAFSLMGVFKGIKSIISLTKTLFSQETVAKIANAAATYAQVDAERKLNREKGAKSTKTTKKSIKDTWNETAYKSSQGLDPNAKMTKMKNGTYSVEGKKGFVSGKDVSGAGKGALKHMGKFALGAAVVVASVVAASAIIKAASDYYNRFDIAAKKAKETAAAIQKHYEDVKNTETEFRSNISEYQDGIEGLKELTKGTDEYKEAVRKANEEALELLKTHKNLRYTVEDGLIKINEDDLIAAEQESWRKESYASAAAMAAQQDAENAQTEANKVNYARTNMKSGQASWDSDDTTAVAGGVGAGAALGTGGAILLSAAVANSWNPVGWALIIAGAIAAVIGIGIATFNNDAEERELKTLDALAAKSKAEGGRGLREDEIKEIADKEDPSGKLAESLLKDIDATNNMIAELRANTEAIDRNNDLIANQLLMNNGYVAGSENYDEIVDRTGDVYGVAYEEYLNSGLVQKWGKVGIAQIDGANAEAKQVWSEYLKYAGLEDKGYQLVDTTGNDDNRIFVYLDEQGQRQEKTLAEMQKMYAAYLANQEATTTGNKLVKYFNEWSKKESSADQAIAAFILNKDFEEATSGEITAMQNEINSEQYGGDVTAYLTAKFGDIEAAAQQLGYENGDALVTAFTNAIDSADVNWEDISLPGLDPTLQENMKINTAQALENIMRTMNASPLGEVAGEQFINGLNVMLQNVDPKDQQEIMEKIAAIDWTQWDAADQVGQILADAGYSINMSESQFKEWVNTMNQASGATYDYATVMKDLNEIIKNSETIKVGDIISKEQYDRLVKTNAELTKFYRLQADGSAEFVGDPLDYKQAVLATSWETHKDNILGAQSNLTQGMQGQAAYDWIEQTDYSAEQLSKTTWGDYNRTKEEGAPQKMKPNKVSLWNHIQSAFDQGFTDPSGVRYEGGGRSAQDFAGYTPVDDIVQQVVDPDLYQKQMDFLVEVGKYTAAEVQTKYGEKTEANANALAKEVETYLAAYTDKTDQEIHELKMKAVSAEIAYARLADAQKRQEMVSSGTISAEAAAAADLEDATAEKWENIDSDEVEAYSKHLQNVMGLNEEAAEDVALYTIKMNKGIESLVSGFDEWASAISQSSNVSEEYSVAMTKMKAALSDVLGVEEDFLTDNFVAGHLDLIREAANGSAEAIDTLAKIAGEEMLIKLAWDDQSANQLINMQNELLAMDNLSVGVDVVANIDGFKDAAQDIIDTAGMTVEEAQAYFNALGYEPVFETEPATVPLTGTRTYTDDVEIGEVNGYQYIAAATTRTEEVETGATQTIQVPILHEKNGKKVPQIKSLTKKTSGAMNNSSSINKGGKKSGSGSKKDKKDLNQEKERYYEINQALDTLTKKMERVGLAKERAFGKAKSDLIKQEIALLDEEIAKTDELLTEIGQYTQEDMANLAAFGFTFDADNNITNYDEIMAAEVNRYNTAIASGDESEIAAAEERWKLFEDYLKQYEDTMDKWDDTVTKQMEDKNKKYQLLFDDITYNVEVKLSLEEDQIKLLDHFLSMLEDEAFSAAEAIGLLGDKTQATLNQAAIYADGITDILSLHGLDKETLDGVMNGSIAIEDIKDEYGFSDEDVSQIRSYVDGLMQANVDLMQLRNTVQEKVIETFQEWNEEMDRGISKLDHLSGVIDAYQNIVDLVGKAALGVDSDLMIKMSKAKTANAQDTFKANKAKYGAVVEARNKAEAEYQAAIERGDEASIKKWEDTLNQLDEEVQTAHSEMLDSWQSTLEAAQEQFELTVEETIATFEKAMSGTFGSFDALQEVFNQQNEIMDRYVQDYTKIYELTKLTRDIMNSIDETDNVKAKRALRDLQEEITALQESDKKMSQYDLDYLRKKYELRVAEIALEEAQNAKSQVRMRKDSEGNYSYVFTADEQAIAEAQQNYEDKLYEMQELNTNYIREMQNNILQSEIELTNALRALDRSKYASDEEYYAEVNRLQGYYAGQHTYYLDELNKGLNNNQLTYSQDWYQYSQYTGYKISADQDYIDSFNETVYAQLTGYNTIAEAQEAYLGGTQIMVDGLITAYKEWYANVETTMNNAGTSMKDFADDAEDAVDKVTTESQEAADEVADAADKFVDEFGKVCDEVTAWQEAYSDAIDLALESNTDMMTSCTDLINMLSDVDGGLDTTSQKFAATAAAVEAAAARIAAAAAAAASAASGLGNYDNNPTQTQHEGTTNGSGGTGADLAPYVYNSDKKQVTGRSYAFAPVNVQSVTSSGWELFGTYLVEKGMGGTRRAVLVSDYLVSSGATQASLVQFKTLSTSSIPGLGGLPPFGFDTGGYTGTWGNEGRIAMLHQKELVLNAQDTENMLNAVNIIRDISRVIDLNAASSANAFNLISSTYATNGGQTIEQEVTIHAEFPNATNHTEIEEAFNTLINQAAQFANRKN